MRGEAGPRAADSEARLLLEAMPGGAVICSMHSTVTASVWSPG